MSRMCWRAWPLMFSFAHEPKQAHATESQVLRKTAKLVAVVASAGGGGLHLKHFEVVNGLSFVVGCCYTRLQQRGIEISV